MSNRRPWFTVMTSGDPNRSGSTWTRVDAASVNRVVVRSVTSDDWLSVAAFTVAWLTATLAIWVWGFWSGAFSMAFAIMATVLVAGILIASFIRVVCIRMAEPPPRD